MKQSMIIGFLLGAYACSGNNGKAAATPVSPNNTAQCVTTLTTTLGERAGLETITSGVEMCLLAGEQFKVRGKAYVDIPEGITTSDNQQVAYSFCVVRTDGKSVCSDGRTKVLNEAKKDGTLYIFDGIELTLRGSIKPGEKPKITISIPGKGDTYLYTQDHYINNY